ncbi:succinate dehydrogenase cytochrome b560 subunit, mitochondrial-like [Clytia hemisphaerica]|uniref:Succinate dehydrogenase cytochrome b560 subunit, mitochondrial n=1 Tax=Clytia hemisphaerica TaxID=252671 RepID=A0A7M5V1U2_9CNID
MASTVRMFRLTCGAGKKSLFQQAFSQCARQSRVSLSTSSVACQDVVRKIVPNEGFWDKNEQMKRPMSPHLTIYKFELPALMSGTHRATGFYLSGVIAAAGVAALVLPANLSSYVELVKTLDLPLWVLMPAKASIVLPVVYHAINGVRHLAWDTGTGFEMGTLYKTGFVVGTLSLLVTGGIVAYFSDLI